MGSESEPHDCLRGRCLAVLRRMEISGRFRYYFQHPWSRLLVAYLVTFFNLLIFAEDPVSHSQTEAHMIVVGNCFSFVVSKYPGGGWNVLKVLMWILAIITGLIAGKFLFHRRLLGRVLRLKMFREDHGSWMTMFFSTILSLFIFSHIYDLILLATVWRTAAPFFSEIECWAIMSPHIVSRLNALSMAILPIVPGHNSTIRMNVCERRPHTVTEYMGIRNESFMKMAAVGTWMGDFVTAWMVTDMMLQDTHYPYWGRSARQLWRHNRIVLFRFKTPCQESLRNAPEGLEKRSTDSGSALAFSDWEFPHFMGDLDMNLPGLSTMQLKIKLPVCKRIFKDEYHIHIMGKWFNYGIIFMVLILDLNMWKNQIFYKPYEYGQYVGPGEKIYTVEDPETLRNFNRSTLTWEWRSTNTDPLTNRTYVQRDMFLHSRYVGVSLDIKCLAFIPSLAAFVLIGFFIWLFGRFQDSETFPENQDKSYERIKRKSASDLGVTPEEVHITMSEALKRNGTPMLLLVDTHHFGSSNSSMSPCTNETQETQPSVAFDSGAHEDTADVKKLTP
ncbi:transmembrane protein 117-like [Sinocyclocheilus anshuiensis]|uniref:transmembrane protein 117-like n=1 Tax=Sinocyclocheilus anshuiensis TaxID=1608454 RepID=UPI0007B9AE8B|nr:PREDICTED: transmembrane protein 117-like [Sinocyclocheilus anshuiensis]